MPHQADNDYKGEKDVTRVFRDVAMLRQATESVMIGKVEDHRLINTKTRMELFSHPESCGIGAARIALPLTPDTGKFGVSVHGILSTLYFV